LSRRVQLVVLCEDKQHETFIRQFLKKTRRNDPVAARMTELANACHEAGVPVRFPEEGVLVVVPTWRIETWLAYLDGAAVDESKRNYPRLQRERDCAPHVDTLVAMCRSKELRPPAPHSLAAACTEWDRWAASA
jgi:hypothetical protein